MGRGESDTHVIFDVAFSPRLLVPSMYQRVDMGQMRGCWSYLLSPIQYPLFSFFRENMEDKGKGTPDLMHCICAGDREMTFQRRISFAGIGCIFDRVGFIAMTTVTWHWAFSRQIHCSLRLWVVVFFFALNFMPCTRRSPGFSVWSEVEDEEKVYACNVIVGQVAGRLQPGIFGKGIRLLGWKGCDPSRLETCFVPGHRPWSLKLEARSWVSRTNSWRRIACIWTHLSLICKTSESNILFSVEWAFRAYLVTGTGSFVLPPDFTLNQILFIRKTSNLRPRLRTGNFWTTESEGSGASQTKLCNISAFQENLYTAIILPLFSCGISKLETSNQSLVFFGRAFCFFFFRNLETENSSMASPSYNYQKGTGTAEFKTISPSWIITYYIADFESFWRNCLCNFVPFNNSNSWTTENNLWSGRIYKQHLKYICTCI